MSSLAKRLIQGDIPNTQAPDALCGDIRESISYWFEHETDVSTKGKRGAPDWHVHEDKTWQVGESLRKFAASSQAFASHPAFHALLRWVLRAPQVGLGRQPFVELAARYDLDENVEAIAALLDEPGLTGQAIKALRTQGVEGYSEQVRAAIESRPAAWVKREAKRYLAAFG